MPYLTLPTHCVLRTAYGPWIGTAFPAHFPRPRLLPLRLDRITTGTTHAACYHDKQPQGQSSTRIFPSFEKPQENCSTAVSACSGSAATLPRKGISLPCARGLSGLPLHRSTWQGHSPGKADHLSRMSLSSRLFTSSPAALALLILPFPNPPGTSPAFRHFTGRQRPGCACRRGSDTSRLTSLTGYHPEPG